MNSKAKSFIKNFSYTFMANAVSFLISAVLVFFVPKRLGVEQYGYWQLYTLYTCLLYTSAAQLIISSGFSASIKA